MYTPTMDEMNEMGFIITNEGMLHKDFPILISYHFRFYYDKKCKRYPQSRQDIETLIRLLTPPSLKG